MKFYFSITLVINFAMIKILMACMKNKNKSISNVVKNELEFYSDINGSPATLQTPGSLATEGNSAPPLNKKLNN